MNNHAVNIARASEIQTSDQPIALDLETYGTSEDKRIKTIVVPTEKGRWNVRSITSALRPKGADDQYRRTIGKKETIGSI